MSRCGLILAVAVLVPVWGLRSFAPVAAQAPAGPDRYILPGDAVFPEGIAYAPATNSFYVGSTGDGTIFRGSVATGEVQVFSPGGSDGRTIAIGMKVDAQGRLFVAGGNSGDIYIYNTVNRALISRLATGSSPTFINDVTVTPSGEAYFTDSQSPVLYKVAANSLGIFAVERFINFVGTPIVYGQGTALNGIAASADGRYLIVVQTNTGQLFRIEVATKAIVEIDLGGETLTNGDGVVLDGQLLYAVRNRLGVIAVVRLAPDFASGVVVNSLADPSFAFPTTAAKVGDRLLVVNSQFDRRGPGLSPVLPFTVSSVAIPAATPVPGLPNTGGGGGQSRAPRAAILLIVGGLLALLGGSARGARRARHSLE